MAKTDCLKPNVNALNQQLQTCRNGVGNYFALLGLRYWKINGKA